MPPLPPTDVYSPHEIALAAGVPVADVVAAVGRGRTYVSHEHAVRVGRALRQQAARRHEATLDSLPLFTRTSAFALSSSVHAGIVASVVFLTSLGLSPSATTLMEASPADMRLVFLAEPGPGGGGGGGGRKQRLLPPKAMRTGHRSDNSPLPARRPPEPVEPAPVAREPEPTPIEAEPLPAIVAPIVSAPADERDRAGVLAESDEEGESRGPGQDGGAGEGTGTGLGSGDGPGVGPGSGGGAGGGPYRPGSGIEPPRLLREVRADYTEQARRSGVEGEVVLEIVVRRDGTVGDVTLVRRLGRGLDERAVQAVRQWRFSPATRRGSPVDVLVEVAVEFKLR
jgi:TonB family protein